MYDHPALALAASQHGAVARFQLRAVGLTFSNIDQLAASRHWAAVTADVLVREGSPPTVERRLMVALLDAGPGAVLSHLCAGRRWGLTGCATFPVHVTRVGSTRRRSPLARVHRVRLLPEPWVTRLHDLPIVRPELLALQLFAVCSFKRAERLTDRLWSLRLLAGPSLRQFIDEMGRSGRNGTHGVRVYLDKRPADYVPPASNLEGRFMDLMEEAGIPMRRQVDSGGKDRWTGQVDFRHVNLPLIVEVQSEAFHVALCDQEDDRRRVTQLQADGFHVLEITDDLVWTSPGKAIRQVRRAVEGALQATPSSVL